MQKSFATVEEIISDEMFLSWFYKESDEKVKAWEKWLSENPSFQSMADEAAKTMKELHGQEIPVSSQQVEAQYYKLSSALEEFDSNMAPVVPLRTNRRRWWIGAAAAVLLLVAGFTFYKYSASSPILETQYGQVSQQQLPDGSEVMLNAHTSVTLSDGWKEGNDREVWLKGEAFFHVKKTPHKNRFIVHTDQLDVIVTGTQFNVKTTPEKTSVLLTEGSVTIKTADGKQLTMQPGDFIEIQNNKAERKTTSQETILAWKENKMNFEKTPMQEVAVLISNHYGVEVKLADDSVAAKTITGMMPNNNLETLLIALEATTEFKITRTQNTIHIAKP